MQAIHSTVQKRSIVIGSQKTSISLEDSFWTSLKQNTRERTVTIAELIAALDATRKGGNLSWTIRVFLLDHYRHNVATNSQSCVKCALLLRKAMRPPIDAKQGLLACRCASSLASSVVHPPAPSALRPSA
jgi:predicted DNA-binding ribbon-helix-helix protein